MNTWISCAPNSLFKLWDNARMPNLPAENAEVVLFPLQAAVAPVKRRVPRFPAWLSLGTDGTNKYIIIQLDENHSRQVFESQDSLLCKETSTDDVDIDVFLDLFGCNVQETFKHGCTSVEKSNAYMGIRPMLFYRIKRPV